MITINTFCDDTILNKTQEYEMEKTAASFYTSSEIASLFGFDEQTVRRQLKRGVYPGAFKVGREWRIPRAAVDQLRQQHPAA